MLHLKDIEEKYKIGQKIFEQLFKLSDAELKTKLLDLLNGEDNDILTNNCTCKRIIENEVPSEINFWFYDGIKVNWSGVTMVSEHGQESKVIKFNKNFKL